MRRSRREQAVYLLSIVFAAAPFGFGLIRAASARDLRMLWMACAAFVGAALVRVVWKDRGRTSDDVVRPSAVTWSSRQRSPERRRMGSERRRLLAWPVAFVLGLCLATSHTLHLLSLPRRS
jgi:hypothetical protein